MGDFPELNWLLKADVPSLGVALSLLVLGSTRFATAMLVLPLLPPDIVPSLCRNALFVLFGAIALAVQPSLDMRGMSYVMWLLLFGKELILGACLGLLFGSVLWAFEAAGQFIDGKAGTTSSQVNDPAAGQQVSLNGLFFAKLGVFVFMYSGGFLLLVGTVLQSYGMWPMMSPKPLSLDPMLRLFEGEFGRIFLLALLISAPVIVTLFAVDFSLGLINRFAPQLNLFSLAMSAKVWVSSLVILVMLTSLVQQLLQEILSRPQITMKALEQLFGK